MHVSLMSIANADSGGRTAALPLQQLEAIPSETQRKLPAFSSKIGCFSSFCESGCSVFLFTYGVPNEPDGEDLHVQMAMYPIVKKEMPQPIARRGCSFYVSFIAKYTNSTTDYGFL